MQEHTNPCNTHAVADFHRISFYVPPSHCEAVKLAMFDAGGGRLGHYEHCAWQCEGQGQFRPLAGSEAYVGELGQLEYVTEIKVEMLCSAACLQAVIEALLEAHPYETPAFASWPVALGATDLGTP